jgi:hypothetical protein
VRVHRCSNVTGPFLEPLERDGRHDLLAVQRLHVCFTLTSKMQRVALLLLVRCGRELLVAIFKARKLQLVVICIARKERDKTFHRQKTLRCIDCPD